MFHGFGGRGLFFAEMLPTQAQLQCDAVFQSLFGESGSARLRSALVLMEA